MQVLYKNNKLSKTNNLLEMKNLLRMSVYNLHKQIIKINVKIAHNAIS